MTEFQFFNLVDPGAENQTKTKPRTRYEPRNIVLNQECENVHERTTASASDEEEQSKKNAELVQLLRQDTLTENYSGEKCRKDLCFYNLDKADKAGDIMLFKSTS